MKRHYSISLKLTIIVVAVSAAVIFSLTFYNIYEQSISFENVYVDKAKDTASVLDVLWDAEEPSTSISEAITMIKQRNVEHIDFIHVFTKNDTTTSLFLSTNLTRYENDHSEYIKLSINKSRMVKIPVYTPHLEKMTVIVPVNASTNVIGAYEFSFFTDESYAAFEARKTNLLLISFVSLFVLIFGFLFLLRHTIVKPIMQFRDAARVFGKGNLTKRIHLSSKDEIGELATAFNSMAEDIKRSQETLEKYNRILERLIKQKDEFIGQLGHDLKNPLQPLIGLLPILVQQEKDPKMKKHLNVLNENAQYMKELIFKTLQLAKLRTENIRFEYEKLNLSDLVKQVIVSQGPLLDENKITIRNKIKPNIQIFADSLRVKEVFKNLIANAVKYTPDTGGAITISAEEKEDFVQILIKDTGIGMTSEEIEKIFDEFYRADSSTHGQDSVGLGLSITKRIIEKHNGTIWVTSEGPGKGSTFYFTLPKKEVKEKHEENNDS
jgi:signal transduction histidine kinase